MSSLTFEERQNYIILSIYKKIFNITSSKKLYKLLNEVAFYRYETAKNLGDEDFEKFGKARFINAEWGRAGKLDSKIWDKEYMDKMYYPFNYKLKSRFEVLITPVYKKYDMYDRIINELCFGKHSLKSDESYYDYKGFTNFIVKDILWKSDNGVYINSYNKIPLTMFYYERDKELIQNVDKYGNKDFLSSNILLYKSIIHTPPELHEYLLFKCLDEIIKFNDNSEKSPIGKMDTIASIFWYLSHATLYERGSASVSEVICSALLTLLYGDFDNIIVFSGKKNITMLDIEAMILPKNEFITYWKTNISNFIKKVKISAIKVPIGNNNKLKDNDNNDILEDLKLEFTF